MNSSFVCRPGQPHDSPSTPGEQHVDYKHYEVFDNGAERPAGKCEGGQHITGSIVETVKSFFGGDSKSSGGKGMWSD